MEQVSTRVVINGDAMIAGSICSFLAINGKTHPISFEITIVATRDNHWTRASPAFLYMIRMRIPLASASATPTIRETRNSLNMTRNRSEN